MIELNIGKPLIPAMVLAALIGCAAPGHAPEPNPSPQSKFVIAGQKDAGLEAHFRMAYAAEQADCLIHRPYSGGGVVRTHHGDRISFAAGIDAFNAEFFLDGYLSGDCQWRPTGIEVSINRPPYNGLLASWAPLAAFGFMGTTGLEQVVYACMPNAPSSRVMWCKGPLVNVTVTQEKLHVSFVDETGAQWPGIPNQ